MAKKIEISSIMAGICEHQIFKVLNAQIYEKKKENLYLPVPKGKELLRIRSYLPRHIAETVKISELKEIYQQLQTDERFELPYDAVTHPHLMMTDNGIVDVRSAKFVEEDKHLFIHANNFSYEEKASWEECPNFAKMIETSGFTEADRTLLLETIGFTISECIGAKAAIFYVGPPDCGKSVLLNFIGRVVGEDYTTAIPLNKLAGKFNKARLATSCVNICTEISSDKMTDVEIFKAITSNDRIMGEHKGEAPFEFTVTTKLIFSGNMLPVFPELEGADALLKRFVILKFPRSVAEKDLELGEKLWQERDVICSLAIKELKHLIARKFSFTEPEAVKNIKEEMKAELNMFDSFIEEKCEFDPAGKIHFIRLWDSFQDFCRGNGFDLDISKQQFSQRIGSIKGVKHSRFRLNGESLRGFEGIRLKEEIIWMQPDSGK